MANRVATTYTETVVGQPVTILERVGTTYTEVVVGQPVTILNRVGTAYIEVLVSSVPRQGWGVVLSQIAAAFLAVGASQSHALLALLTEVLSARRYATST